MRTRCFRRLTDKPRSFVVRHLRNVTKRIEPWGLVLLLMGTLPHAPVVAAPPAECGNQKATIVGTSSDDVIKGTSGDDVIVAKGGDDVVEAGRGNDTICAGAGDDVVRAGKGFQDSVYAQSGDDLVYGGPGRNLLVAGEGRDLMYGSSHFDNFESPNGESDPQPDIFVGRGRADSFASDAGNDTFKGGKGPDRLTFFDSPAGVRIDLAAGTASGDGIDSFSSIRDVVASKHDDTINGTEKRDFVFDPSGDDVIHTLGGNDEISDGAGEDVIDAGTGDDEIHGAFCVSGSDGPTYCQTDPPAPDTLIGGPGDDLISSGPGDDVIKGNDGNDVLYGGDGVDEIFGDAGNDILFGGSASGEDPPDDDGKIDHLDGGDGRDECRPLTDERTNCES